MSPSPRPDRRVQRTRDALRDALVSLLLERGWDEVSVQDVCERANVGRSTFYTHFPDKEALLTSGFDALGQALRALRDQPAPPAAVVRFAGPLFAHAHEPTHEQLYRVLAGRRSGQLIQRRFRRLLVDLLREEAGPEWGSGDAREATILYVAGGFLELLQWSLDARPRPGPEEVDRLFQTLTARVLGR